MKVPQVGQTTKEWSLLGRRDAFHIPGILVKSSFNIPAGTKVRFTDDSCKEVVPLYKEDFYTTVEDENGEEINTEITLEAHAVVDPFKPYSSREDFFWVFPVPGSVNNLTHQFNLDLEITKITEKELELIQNAADEEEGYQSCKGCY